MRNGGHVIGAMAGLPTDVPFLYSGLIAFNILLFAFVGQFSGAWGRRASRA